MEKELESFFQETRESMHYKTHMLLNSLHFKSGRVESNKQHVLQLRLFDGTAEHIPTDQHRSIAEFRECMGNRKGTNSSSHRHPQQETYRHHASHTMSLIAFIPSLWKEFHNLSHVPALQNGQTNVVSSFGLAFFGCGFLLAFRFAIFFF